MSLTLDSLSLIMCWGEWKTPFRSLGSTSLTYLESFDVIIFSSLTLIHRPSFEYFQSLHRPQLLSWDKTLYQGYMIQNFWFKTFDICIQNQRAQQSIPECCVFETGNYWHVVGWLSGFNLRSEAWKAEQWRPWPVYAEQGPLPVTHWHFCINTL